MNILILNGSPAGETSAALQTLLSVAASFPGHQYDVLHIGRKDSALEADFSSARGKLERADLILFCCPACTLLTPVQLYRFLDLVKERGVRLAGKFAAEISVAEGVYDLSARELIRESCAELGLRYMPGFTVDRKFFHRGGREEALEFFRDALENVKNDVSETDQASTLENAALRELSEPMIALTFDDGPGGDSSDRILELLSQYDAHATFFMIGKNAMFHPDKVLRKLELGHEIGSHTWDHEHCGDDLTREDIVKGARAIESITGVAPSCFRSPEGRTTLLIRKICGEMGLPLYYWSLDTNDWQSRDAQKVYEAVINQVTDGDIVLMHEIYDSTAQALERILPVLAAQGYRFVTCGELIRAKTGKEPAPGKQYCNSSCISNYTS